jgi:hypothetical protein
LAKFHRHYTRAEAQELIPWIRGIFEKIHMIFETQDGEKDEGEAALAVSVARRRVIHSNGNGKHDHSHAALSAEELVGGMETGEKQTLLRGLVKAILDRGILIQDLRRGLIDFPAWKDSREVLLCYELDDGEFIRFWHELEAGYAGRQELEDWA